MSYAMQQKASLGSQGFGGFGNVGEIPTTLFSPTQLAFIAGWVLIALRFLVFYPAAGE